MAALNYDLHNVVNFGTNHCLKLNSDKSIAVIFGGRMERHRFIDDYSGLIQIQNREIKVTNIIKNLGLYIDNDLRFTEHITKCLQKAYCNLRLIFQQRHVFVLSHFNYCDGVYSPCLTEYDSRRIQKVQNSCLRLIFGVRKYDHISSKLIENNWLSMSPRRYLHMTCQYHTILQNRAPSYLYRKIRFRTDVHNINIRFKGKLTIPRHNLHLYKRSFSYNIASLMNSFTEETLSMSKFRFKRYVFNSLSRIPK